MNDIMLADKIWNYMQLEHPLEKADVIIGLGSFYQGIADWCAKLWHDGLAPKILFCGNTGTFSDSEHVAEAVRYSDRAQALGVSADAIITDPDSRNTGQNIVYGHKKLTQAGIYPEKVILVTAPCFLRRGYATAMKQWPAGHTPEFICSSTPISYQQYIELNEHESDIIDILVGNLGRMKTFVELGFQIEQEIPEEIWAAYETLVERGYTKYLA